jgi:phenylacetate-CoA ligase
MNLLSVLPDGAVRRLRQWLLAQGRRMDPQQWQARSQKRAWHAVRHAARHSTAYQSLLAEQGLHERDLRGGVAWQQLPVLTKGNSFARFSLAQLARPVDTRALADVLTSSGRGGRSFGFRLSERRSVDTAWFDTDLGLQDAFNVDQRRTLLVNCLPMGVVFASRAVTVANVSVRADMACSILRDVGPLFDQTLVCTDPLFVRALLDEGRSAGVDWRALKTSVIVGEEMLVEAQRDFIADRMGIELERDSHRLVGSSFGVGELGLNLLFESRETIRMRRALRRHPEWLPLIGGPPGAGKAGSLGIGMDGDALPSLFCYNPLRCFIEVLDPDEQGFGELCITLLDLGAVIPLPRYATGDRARLLSLNETQQLAQLSGTPPPWLPVVVVQGRRKDRPPGMPTVEAIKELLYRDPSVAEGLTGAFRLGPLDNGAVGLTVQAATAAAVLTPDLQQRLARLLAQHGLAHLQLDLVAPTVFPWRPLLDYERKFAYVQP